MLPLGYVLLVITAGIRVHLPDQIRGLHTVHALTDSFAPRVPQSRKDVQVENTATTLKFLEIVRRDTIVSLEPQTRDPQTNILNMANVHLVTTALLQPFIPSHVLKVHSTHHQAFDHKLIAVRAPLDSTVHRPAYQNHRDSVRRVTIVLKARMSNIRKEMSALWDTIAQKDLQLR